MLTVISGQQLRYLCKPVTNTSKPAKVWVKFEIYDWTIVHQFLRKVLVIVLNNICQESRQLV